MKITIDTREPLAEVLRVVQAAYQVTVSVDQPGNDPAQQTGPAETKATTRARARRSKAPASSRANGRAPRKTAARTRGSGSTDGGTVSVAAVRAWARDNGHQVRATGRVPVSLIQAYREAH